MAVTPLGAVVRGLAAGAVGTLAMDLVWYARYRREGGRGEFVDWELSPDVENWESAPTPAQVGKRLVEGLFQTELSKNLARPMNNVVHWGYGLVWGAAYGILAGSLERPRIRNGLWFGPFVWSTGYVVLPLAGLYKRMWEYDAKTLGRDGSAHLVYGLGTAAAFRILTGRLTRDSAART